MSIPPKKGIRWWIFNRFGPPEVQNLVDYIDSHATEGEIWIYPAGEFVFNVKTSLGNDVEPIVFPTLQERNAFQHGLSYGVGLMGGTTAMLTKEDFDIIDEMKKSSTHSGGNGRNN